MAGVLSGAGADLRTALVAGRFCAEDFFFFCIRIRLLGRVDSKVSAAAEGKTKRWFPPGKMLQRIPLTDAPSKYLVFSP